MTGIDRANEGHDCATCPGCIHDGNKCCGCYDGACCQTSIKARTPGERAAFDDGLTSGRATEGLSESEREAVTTAVYADRGPIPVLTAVERILAARAAQLARAWELLIDAETLITRVSPHSRPDGMISTHELRKALEG